MVKEKEIIEPYQIISYRPILKSASQASQQKEQVVKKAPVMLSKIAIYLMNSKSA